MIFLLVLFLFSKLSKRQRRVGAFFLYYELFIMYYDDTVSFYKQFILQANLLAQVRRPARHSATRSCLRARNILSSVQFGHLFESIMQSSLVDCLTTWKKRSLFCKVLDGSFCGINSERVKEEKGGGGGGYFQTQWKWASYKYKNEKNRTWGRGGRKAIKTSSALRKKYKPSTQYS